MALVLKMDNNRATNKEMFVTLSSQNDSTSRSNRQTAVSVLTAIQVVKMINQKKTESQTAGGKKHLSSFLSQHCSNLVSVTAHKNKQACNKVWRCTRPKVVDWQAARPFRTLLVRLGSSLGSPCFITCCPSYWFDQASLRQTPVGPDPGVGEAKSRVTGSATSSGLFTIGWWSVTSQLIDRWVKSMLRLARREIMADEITTVPNGGKWNMIDPTRTILGGW